MVQAKAHKSKLEEMVPEIEEKDDKHIAYLEAQMEGWSFAEEDRTKVDHPKDKRVKIWKELILPLITLVVPSTSQQTDTADSVASMI